MSTVYATEPQTAGRVIFETTHGPLELSLWSRECPATTRLFLQLCLDGYYEGMLFHRIVPNFLIQTGAMRQTTNAVSPSSEKDLEVYRNQIHAPHTLERRSYELNSRIRFNHRGQVAMALGVSDEDDLAILQPQFFITLDEASHLDGKHVVFGTVTGPTVFNALRIGQIDVDEATMQPTAMEHAPRIERVKILDNPIHTDIVPTAVLPWKEISAASTTDHPAKKKKKRKGVKNVNVLSFGDEMQDDDGMDGGIQSSHDVIGSGFLSKEVDKQLRQVQVITEEPNGSSKRKKSKKKRGESENDNESSIEKNSIEENVAEKAVDDSSHVDGMDDAAESAFKEHAPESTSHTFVSSKQKESVPEPPPSEPDKPDGNKPGKKKEKKVSLVEMRRAKYANKGAKDKRKREEDTMAKLIAFQTKVVKDVANSKASKQGNDDKDNSLAARMVRNAKADEPDEVTDAAGGSVAYHGQVLEDEEEDEGGGKGANDWLKTRFKCRKHMDHDAKLGGDGRNALDYEVVDDLAKAERKKEKRHQHQHHWHKGSSGRRDKRGSDR
jgi:peptidyl-prolyl cis-trans isomerase SDCCAG10